MATILNLFSDAVWQGLLKGAPAKADELELMRQEAIARIQSKGQGCCQHCHLRGLCGDDECGAREYSGARFKWTDKPQINNL